MNIITKFLNSYDYDGPKEFLLSLFPSFKYGLQGLSLFLSAIAALTNEFIGIGPALALAMLIAVIVEVRTGCMASSKQSKPFESLKFSRCVIKTSIWISLLYFIHAFHSECLLHEDWMYVLGAVFFSIVQIFVMAGFVIEHITSILENLAIIDGKPKDALINNVIDLWNRFTDLVKNKMK